jgi:hypothetical protein
MYMSLDYQSFIASTIASFISIIECVVVADSMAYLTRLFKNHRIALIEYSVKKLEFGLKFCYLNYISFSYLRPCLCFQLMYMN